MTIASLHLLYLHWPLHVRLLLSPPAVALFQSVHIYKHNEEESNPAERTDDKSTLHIYIYSYGASYLVIMILLVDLHITFVQ